MLVSAERFINTPVMSLQTGSELARTARAVINPRNLSVVAYELEGRMLDSNPTLLRIDDIREIGPLGIIIDSTDELIQPSDVIKIKEIYGLQFNLIGLKVVDDNKRNVGKTIGYTVESGSFIIQQLRIKRPLLKSFGDTELLVHRSQIIKVTDEKIIVKSPKIRHTEPVVEPAQAAFENPFRKNHQSQPETADN